MTAFLLGQLPLFVLLGLGIASLAFPAILLGTERGRYLLVTGVVIACVWWTWNARFSAGRAACNAEHAAKAESARADAAESALKQSGKSEQANADATGAARSSGDNRRQEQAARAARVKDYADASGDSCTGNADILRELQEGSGRVRAAEGGLRR